MKLTNLRAKIERSLPLLSSDDLAKVSAFIDGLTSLPKAAVSQDNQRSQRLQWVERLRQNRSQLSIPSDRQTVLEMREEERY
jgi:hypothetical protein